MKIPLERQLGLRLRALLLGVLLVLSSFAIPNLEIVTQLEGLLPTSDAGAQAYQVFLEEFGGGRRVYVLVATAGGDSLTAAHVGLERLLGQIDGVLSVRSGVSVEEMESATAAIARQVPNRALADQGWEEFRAHFERPRLEARAAEIKRGLSGPLGPLKRRLFPLDPLGLVEERSAIEAGRASEEVPRRSASAGFGDGIDLTTGLFRTPGGEWGLVVLETDSSELDAVSGRRLVNAFETARRTVERDLGVGVELRAVGGPLYAAADQASVRGDLTSTLGLSLFGCFIILVLGLRSLKLPIAMAAIVGSGVVLAAGTMALLVPQISAVALAFSVVLVGLGVDYVIHIAARVKLSGDQQGDQAVADAWLHSGRAVLAAASSTVAGFAVLLLSGWHPLRQVGLLVVAGVASMLVATWLGSWFLSGPRRREGRLRTRERKLFWSRLIGAVEKRPRSVIFVFAALGILSLLGLRGLEFSGDLSSIRPENRDQRETERLLAQFFDVGRHTASILVSAEDLKTSMRRAEEVREFVESEAEGVQIESPSRWFDQSRVALSGLQRAELSGLVDDFERALVGVGVNPSALNPGLGELRALGLEELDNGWNVDGRDIPGVSSSGTVLLSVRWSDGSTLEEHEGSLAREVEQRWPGVKWASAGRLASVIKKLAQSDLRRLGLIALLVVLTVVLLAVRRVGLGLVAVIPACFGGLLSLGVWGWAGGNLDLVSVVVLPIVLAIGVDDGLHIVLGSLRRSDSGLAVEAASSGHPILLTSLTTSWAFGCLAFSQMPGLRAGGAIVSVGVLGALVASLFLLPSVGVLIRDSTSDDQ